MSQVFSSSTFNSLHNLLADGKRRAESVSHSVLVSFTHPTDLIVDSIELFSVAKRIDPVVNYWACPSHKSWKVGVGETIVIRVQGPTRFEDASRLIHQAIDEAVVEGIGPVFMGGFRFASRSSVDGIWADFSDGLLVLPQIMVQSSSSGRCLISVNAEVNKQTDAGSTYTKLTGKCARLFEPSSDTKTIDSSLVVDQELPEHWRMSVGRALQAIKEKKIMKVTLARTSMVHSKTVLQPNDVLCKLINNYPQCRVFAFSRGDACFLGASPEVLVSLQGEKVTSTSLAGSVPRGLTETEDSALSVWLLASKKEREEHEVVVKWVAERLRPLCSSLQWNEAPTVMRLGNVQHLETSFVGTAKSGCDILNFVSALHPTPAVGGIPLDDALKMIEQLETADRGWYTGPVGWVDNRGLGEFVIAIRCALLSRKDALLYAGAGIVAGSNPEREYEETNVKFKPLLDALGVQL